MDGGELAPCGIVPYSSSDMKSRVPRHAQENTLQTATPRPTTGPLNPSDAKKTVAALALLVALTFAAYGPSLRGSFVG